MSRRSAIAAIAASALVLSLGACGEGLTQEEEATNNASADDPEEYALGYFELINAGDARACQLLDADNESRKSWDPIVGSPGMCEETVAASGKFIDGRWHTIEDVQVDGDRAVVSTMQWLGDGAYAGPRHFTELLRHDNDAWLVVNSKENAISQEETQCLVAPSLSQVPCTG